MGNNLLNLALKKSVLRLLKQEEIFEEIANESELIKQIHFNSLIYYFNREQDPENLIFSKGAIVFF